MSVAQLTYAPDIHLCISATSASNLHCGVKVAIIQLPIPCHVDRVPTHKTVDRSSIERVGQQLHVRHVLSAHEQVISEALNGHVGESKKRREPNAVISEQAFAIGSLEVGLPWRKSRATRVVDQVETERSGGLAVAMTVQHLKG